MPPSSIAALRYASIQAIPSMKRYPSTPAINDPPMSSIDTPKCRARRRMNCVRVASGAERGSYIIRASARKAANPEHRLEQPRALARRTPTRLQQLVLAEHEPARPTACRHDLDLITCGASGSQCVAEVVLDVASRHAELSRQRGGRTE